TPSRRTPYSRRHPRRLPRRHLGGAVTSGSAEPRGVVERQSGLLGLSLPAYSAWPLCPATMDGVTTLSPTPRSTVRRGKQRARTDRAALYAVLDAALGGHL